MSIECLKYYHEVEIINKIEPFASHKDINIKKQAFKTLNHLKKQELKIPIFYYCL